MAGLLDLFSGRSSDIYGNGLLTPEQRGGLGNIGLLALAGKLGQLAGPSFSPVPDFGAALGQAAGAYGASQEGAGTAALNAILTGQRGRKLEQELDYYKQLGPILSRAAQGWPGAGGGTAATPETGSTGGGAAAPAGAGGDVGSLSDPRGMVPHIQAEATRLGIDIPTALKVAGSEGLAKFSGDGGKSGGAFQLYTGGGMGNDFQRDTGLDPLDPKNEKATITYALERAAKEGWGAWNGAKKLGITGFAGIGKPGAAPTAAAPALNVGERATPLSPGGGLLAPTAPNPLSDAEPMLPIVRPPRAAALSERLGSGGGAGADLLAAGMSPEMVARYLARPAPGAGGAPAAVAPALSRPGASPEDTANQILRGWTAGAGGGGLLAAPPPGAGTDNYVTPQGPAGDVGQAGPAGPSTPLPTMGPAGIELPPMQGPLAAPAPAAAAPAAPGPGLLAPPGALPAAPALPRVNPAFDAYARQLAVAAGLAKGAGLPDALGPLLEVFKSSPAYKAQSEIATRTAAQPFEQAQTLFNKQVEIAGVGPIEAAKLPYALAQAYFKAEQDIRTAGPVAAAQNFERIRADNAAKAIITTKDADGNIKLAIDPVALQAVTGATQATSAAQARGTGSVEPATALRQGPGGPYEAPTTKTALADEVNRTPAGGLPGGVAPPGPNAPIGGLVGKPVYTPGQVTAQEAAATNNEKLIQTYRETADAAASAKTTLQNISGDIGSMVHGPFAPAAQLASSYLRILDPSFNKQVSSYEDLYSNANELVRKAVRQSDPNPSFIQTQMAFQSLPVPEKSPDGLRIITNRMIGVNDHDTARAAAIPVYAQEHGGSNAGFDTWWRGNASPYAFVFMKMAPQDQQALVAKLNTNPQGQREIAKLKQQIAFVNKNGLEQ